ncbi:YqjK-like family protein [Polynucleobacter sp. AP-Ainpum-60-G11]|uniref:YqjK family protein n=1 Tax=Polynucleobacter sp. AP-Ainpum-60-G11 TaxID=2576926 RepID=UPI001BFD7C9B|nr:YqjK-like family protein [Polynucleobacter sp. AP-Ainpum-60-G11]QWE27550.1 YqjK-like family protein [Polynucleobacter sp. AP-Ainpum-60-G11]
MSQKLSDLQARQKVLQERAAQERADFALHFEPIEKPLSWADKGVDAFNLIKNTPVLWTSAFAVLAHYKPKLASKVLAVGWGAVKLLKSAKKLV